MDLNLPTIIIAAIIAAVFLAIVGKGIYHLMRHKGGCSCGCENCPGHDLCHPKS